MKDALNIQISSNNQMNLLSELESLGNIINKTKEDHLAKIQKPQEKVQQKNMSKNATEQDPRTKSWAQVKAEAHAKLLLNKALSKVNETKGK